ncbi:MAG TPA: hypothetical protein VN200_01930 [Rhodoglobus sp.]|nr:hypothetical protein [Rhodoglobus sp.]
MTDTTGSGGTSAREQAAGVASEAKDAGQRVAGTAKDEARNVAGEAKTQARKLVDQAGGELRDQAATQQTRAAQGLRSVGDELRSMAGSSEQGGLATEVVGQVADRVSSTAEWLDARDPGSLLAEVKDFARRKPGLFIAIAAGAGLVAGRLVKNLAAGAPEGGTTPSATGTTASTAGPAGATAPMPTAVPTQQYAASGTGSAGFETTTAGATEATPTFDEVAADSPFTLPGEGERR